MPRSAVSSSNNALPGVGTGWIPIVLLAALLTVSCGGDEQSAAQPRPGITATIAPSLSERSDDPVTPFTNVAPEALRQGFEVWNDRPGVAVFDYDRDGDLDIYITAEAGHANWLYRNDGDDGFTDVAQEAGVAAMTANSTGVAACDLDNDGYQDLYVGAWGNPRDGLGFRSPPEYQGSSDLLFRNNGDGSFSDITNHAFGDAVNIRSATTIACADVDNDGWLDIYVGNLADDDFRDFATANHPGHYNLLFHNNKDLTFDEIAEEAGVHGPQIVMRNSDGRPISFKDPETGERYEGYDPTFRDKLGNVVGEPTGQTHSVMFFDYDDDGDGDLWVANDGDRLHVYRNDSSGGEIRFTPVARAMAIDTVGAWMAFALGDYDGDADLDVFVANIGFHPLLQYPRSEPGGSCSYHMRFAWGTCLHFLLRNDGTREVPEVGTVGDFLDVAPSTVVKPSPLMPPASLDPSNIDRRQKVPSGLSAYDFGFGTTFFDYDNDGDEDLYWLGSTVARGEAPGGQVYPAAGRMLRADGQGGFEDITVRARLLDIKGVDYEGLEEDPSVLDDPVKRRLRRVNTQVHENGKGLAHGDLNGDGYVDLVGTNSSGDYYVGPFDPLAGTAPTRPWPGPVFVWMNEPGDNHWITVRLRGRMAVDGTGSNADGIGARIVLRARTGPDAEVRTHVRELATGSTYLSMNSLDLEFGLGTATVVDELIIRWPSGRMQTLRDLDVDQVLLVTEPEA